MGKISEKNMKKIIISLAIVGVVAAVAIGGTIAYFSDTETSTGNTFTAGTLDLKLDGGDVNVIKFVAATLSNLKPGDSGFGTWIVNNSGSINGYLDIHSISLVDNDNNCNEPELAFPDATCGPTGGGDLSANMDVVLFVDTDNDGVLDSGEATIYNGKLSAIATDYNYNLALAVSGTNYITMTWIIGTGVGNIIQSDSTTLGLTFELGQDVTQ